VLTTTKEKRKMKKKLYSMAMGMILIAAFYFCLEYGVKFLIERLTSL
jgi:flagellar biogenesis protein FliO